MNFGRGRCGRYLLITLDPWTRTDVLVVRNRSPLHHRHLFEQPLLPLHQLSSPWPATSESSFSSCLSPASCLPLLIQGQKKTPVTREKRSHTGASSSTKSSEEVSESPTEEASGTGVDMVATNLGGASSGAGAPPAASPSPTVTASRPRSGPSRVAGPSPAHTPGLTNSSTGQQFTSHRWDLYGSVLMIYVHI